MTNKIIIAGGTGFLGQVLENHLTQKGYQVQILTRKPTQLNQILWDAKTIDYWIEELEGSLAIINLTGKSVDCRYNDKNKALIYSSRIDSTRIIGKAINSCRTPPKIWINSSTATIYRHSLYKEMTEENGEIGNDFSMNIAKAWEKEFYSHQTTQTRKVAIRTSIVLGKKGGALLPLKSITKLLLGGKQGTGNQKVSFIHELDFARAIEFILNNKNISGNINVTAPVPTNNFILMKTLRQYLKIPFGISQPKWLLKIGAYIIGTEAELVLKSRNVIPQRLMNNQFEFKYPNINCTLKNLV
ncbi:TIGR01777 family oxidoreductase [Pseudofulvibacter geojedonensis]|uniref:TIGR01777 family oxidoreductase n=1 Tax=Pseudofulvibacter geojedonensis TaxID=1123758 RepID=A0ABW3I4I7_9FLAO